MRQTKITHYLENLYPANLASNFDFGKIGLQFGSKEKDIKKVMIALDGTTDVIDEAVKNKVDLLITHHPFMFNPLLNLDYDSPFGKKLAKVIENKLNIYSMHTNFDTAIGGMNDVLANNLGLINIHPHKDEVDSSCFIRIGNTEQVTLGEFAKIVMVNLNEPTCKIIGDKDKIISKVGIVGGSGASELMLAIRHKCDCLVTGEIKHNQMLDAIEYDIALIEVSHSVERLFKETLKNNLKENFPELEVILSENDNIPYNVIINE